MLRMILLSTALLASTAIAGPQADKTAAPPPATASSPAVPADPSSTCAYLTTSQGEVPESRDIFDATITQIDGKSTPLGRKNRYPVKPGPHVITVAEKIDAKRVPAAASAQISKMKRLEQQRAYKKVELDVQPGVSYAIGSKLLRDNLDAESVRDNQYWEPIVWDMRPERCP